jgi:membrane protein implicated in regulation of membrane protease activity
MDWRPDRTPTTWLLWQGIEFVIMIAILTLFVPESWPDAAKVAALIVVLAVAWVVNYRWIRRTHEKDSGPRTD